MDGPALTRLRPPTPEVVACKVCGGPAPLFGSRDFNRACEEIRSPRLPPAGIDIPYRRCPRCGLVFTDAFDDWSQADFQAEIYNDGYAAVDPDYETVRPDGNAALIARSYAPGAQTLRVLDYGGGNGRFAEQLRGHGFAHVETYDPFHPDHCERPQGRFNLITCWETMEHLPNPLAGVKDIASFMDEEAMVLFSTMVQPADFDAIGMDWWYIGPRNGHVTIFSRIALRALWYRIGLKMVSTNDAYHAAFRTFPAFAEHLKDP